MREGRNNPSLSSAPLFWRVFILNALVFIAGIGALALTPATVSSPLRPIELVDLCVGLALLLAMNSLLLRVGLTPLRHVMQLMGTVDLLRPGQRLAEREGGDLWPLVRTFNQMLDRLESERAASSRHALLAQEAERERVARELHDEVGQGLTVLLLQLRRSADAIPEPYRETLRQGIETAGDNLADVRRIAQRLRPDVLQNLGLGCALTALAEEFTTYSGVFVHTRLRVSRLLPDPVELAIYRIAQEGLTNIARHSGSSTAELSLDVSREGVRLEVADRGRGIEGEVCAGIRGMRERALLVQGVLEITSRPGHGTQVVLEIPRSSLKARELVNGSDTHSAG